MSDEFFDVVDEGQVRPNTVVSFDVAGTPVAVANVGGRFYAFDDVCTHASCALSDGDLEGATIRCVCHDSQFDVTTGAVLCEPADEPLLVREVRVILGRIQIRS